ncbi:hypothetical protein ACMBCM_08885, partial [Spiroplasma sp. K1]
FGWFSILRSVRKLSIFKNFRKYFFFEYIYIYIYILYFRKYFIFKNFKKTFCLFLSVLIYVILL